MTGSTPDPSGLLAALTERVVVLDGGLATQLEARGHDLSDDLWSARLLIDDPGEIEAAHADFFVAGAEVATTASYQVSYEGLAARGIDRAGADRLLGRSVQLARAATGAYDGARWVAASVGPYGAALADGQEYTGDYGLTVAELRAWHRPRLASLIAAAPDILALETIPCLTEVEALLAEVEGTGVPCWLSLTAVGDRTRRNEPLRDAFAMARDVKEVVAVGVNCCTTETAEVALRLATEMDRPGVVYPNSGEGWDGAARGWVGASTFSPEVVTSWVGSGACLVGGCCRVGPDDIAGIAALVR